MNFHDRIKASYARLALDVEVPERLRAVKPKKHCRACNGEAWSEGLCTECLVERGRLVTLARKRREEHEHRLFYVRARRAARKAGDMQLVNELALRRKHGGPWEIDISPDAKWRAKWAGLIQQKNG